MPKAVELGAFQWTSISSGLGERLDYLANSWFAGNPGLKGILWGAITVLANRQREPKSHWGVDLDGQMC